VEDRPNSFEADRRLRDSVGDLRQILHRLEKLVEIGQEHRQRTYGHYPGEDERRTPPQYKGCAERNRNRDNRGEQRLHSSGLQGGVYRCTAYLTEATFLKVLSSERLHRAH